MKLTSRGFTLVELMIVIAIIGILAAALFPSMTGYLKRSRDTARQAGMKDITTAIGAYYADKEKYPDASPQGCVNSGQLNTTYLPKWVPVDPQSGRVADSNFCSSATNEYSYGSGLIAASPSYAVAASLENIAAANTWGTTGYVGTTPYSLPALPAFQKGVTSASGAYVLMN